MSNTEPQKPTTETKPQPQNPTTQPEKTFSVHITSAPTQPRIERRRRQDSGKGRYSKRRYSKRR